MIAMDPEQAMAIVAELLAEGHRNDGILSFARLDGENTFGVETPAGEFLLTVEVA